MSDKGRKRNRQEAVRPSGPSARRRRGVLSRAWVRFRAGRERRCSFWLTLWRVAWPALWRVGVVCLAAGLMLGGLVLVVSGGMVSLTEEAILTKETVVGRDYDCILVLGAGVRDDGSPSDMLYDRVVTACGVYEVLAGQSKRVPLLMSGDHTGDYNEVGVMKSLAIELGVPGTDVFLDHAGYSTYESLWRAREVFGAKRILIVTQGYHLHRALYIARELGLEADGVSADLRPYRGQTKYELREMLARYKDLFVAARGDDVGEPTGPVDLGGDGNLT